MSEANRSAEKLLVRYRTALRAIYDYAWDHRYQKGCYCGPCCMNRAAARALKKRPRNLAYPSEST